MSYIRKTIKSGQILEQVILHPTTLPKGGRGEKSRESTEQQMKKNRKRSEKELWRVINCNFSHENRDQFATFTFSKAVKEKEAQRLWEGFTRKAREYCRKKGKEFKYASVREKQAQWHIHAVMNYIPLEDLKALWKHGAVDSATLDKGDDFSHLAAYMMGSCKEGKLTECERNMKYARKWTGSKNLKRPEVTVEDLPDSRSLHEEAKAPQGYFLYRDELTVDEFGNEKRYILFKKLSTRTPARRSTPPGQKKTAVFHPALTRGYP